MPEKSGKHFISRFSAFRLCAVIIAFSAPVPVQAAQDSERIAFCKQLAEAYKPSSNVEYKAGVNVHGKPVVPADLNGAAPLDMSGIYPIRIPLKLDIIERYNLDVPDGIIGEAPIAEIVVQQDGRTTYNGHDISGNLQGYCLDGEKPEKMRSVKPSQPEHIPEPDTAQPPVSYDGEELDGQYH